MNQEILRELLNYDPITGEFKWRNSSRMVKAGDVAGTVKRKNREYKVIMVNSYQYRANRLAILYMTGEMPNHARHRDSDLMNNSYLNLEPSETMPVYTVEPTKKDVLLTMHRLDPDLQKMADALWATG